MEQLDFAAFQQLCQSLHFGRAARALGMSPSALTRRVQAMEAELGVELLNRDQRQVGLTRAGERFGRYARQELEQWEQLKNELLQEVDSPSGELRIACTVTACHSLLPSLLARCRERYPRITLRLVTQDASRSLLQLEAGEVDLAVIPTDPKRRSELARCVLGSTELAFIGPADRQLLVRLMAEGGWANAPWIAPPAGLERERLDSWFRSKKAQARIVAEVRGNEGIIAMVSLGGGLALVPRLVLDSSPLPVTVLSELKPPLGYDVSLCARSRSLQREVVKVFWELAQAGR